MHRDVDLHNLFGLRSPPIDAVAEYGGNPHKRPGYWIAAALFGVAIWAIVFAALTAY